MTSSLGDFGGRRADNFVDRLNRAHGPLLLLFLACLVSSKQLVGTPIECWCPAQFTDNQVRYTNSYCWASSTHYLPSDQPVVPRTLSDDYRVTYYQWVPLVLLVQSFLCHAPHLFWRLLLRQNGADVSGMVEAAVAAGRASQLELRERAVCHVASQLDRYTATRRYASDAGCYPRVMNALSRKCFLFGGRNYGNFLANGYLFVKVGAYGIRALNGMFLGMPWSDPDHFPLGTLCEVEIRDQSRIHNYVVQCVLSINIFNEKIFIVLWFWFSALAVVTAFDLIVWTVHNFYWPGAIRFAGDERGLLGTLSTLRSTEDLFVQLSRFVSKRLRAKPGEKFHPDPVLLSRFVRNYLRRDGIVILRLIGCNCGDVITGEILDQLWFCYAPRPSERCYANVKSPARARETSVAMRESSSTVQLI